MPDRQSAEVISDRKNGGKSEAAARCSSWVAAAALVTRKSKNDVSDQRLFILYIYMVPALFLSLSFPCLFVIEAVKKNFYKVCEISRSKKVYVA
jgi:hypothetical protein